VPHAPAGQHRQTLLQGCYAMFGLSLLASVVVITLLLNRLAQHKVGPVAMAPTLWIVLAPLGQSITPANNLGAQTAIALPAPYAGALRAFGLAYGVPVWGSRSCGPRLPGRSPSPSAPLSGPGRAGCSGPEHQVDCCSSTFQPAGSRNGRWP
jgi:hypothetical protein